MYLWRHDTILGLNYPFLLSMAFERWMAEGEIIGGEKVLQWKKPAAKKAQKNGWINRACRATKTSHRSKIPPRSNNYWMVLSTPRPQTNKKLANDHSNSYSLCIAKGMINLLYWMPWNSVPVSNRFNLFVHTDNLRYRAFVCWSTCSPLLSKSSSAASSFPPRHLSTVCSNRGDLPSD